MQVQLHTSQYYQGIRFINHIGSNIKKGLYVLLTEKQVLLVKEKNLKIIKSFRFLTTYITIVDSFIHKGNMYLFILRELPDTDYTLMNLIQIQDSKNKLKIIKQMKIQNAKYTNQKLLTFNEGIVSQVLILQTTNELLEIFGLLNFQKLPNNFSQEEKVNIFEIVQRKSSGSSNTETYIFYMGFEVNQIQICSIVARHKNEIQFQKVKTLQINDYFLNIFKLKYSYVIVEADNRLKLLNDQFIEILQENLNYFYEIEGFAEIESCCQMENENENDYLKYVLCIKTEYNFQLCSIYISESSQQLLTEKIFDFNSYIRESGDSPGVYWNQKKKKFLLYFKNNQNYLFYWNGANLQLGKIHLSS